MVGKLKSTTVIARRGKTLSDIATEISHKQIDIKNYNNIIVLAGTNSLASKPITAIEDYVSLVRIIHHQNFTAKITICSILPRIKEDNSIVNYFNLELQNLSFLISANFMDIHKFFLKNNTPKLNLFAIDGIHPSSQGNKRLKESLHLIIARI